MPTAETILFAVQAGVRLYGAIRKAYVDGTRARTLILPLPRSPGIEWDSAVSFFDDQAADLAERYPRAVELARRSSLAAEERVEILNIYLGYLAVHEPALFGNGEAVGQFTDDEFSALVTIRNWENGEPGVPTALQRISGTVVNVAVDYFLEIPGRISESRPEGRALRTFLKAVDEVDFATVETREVVPSLLVAVLDSVAANPDLFGGGRNEQEFVGNITAALSESAKKHLENAPTTEREDAAAWLSLVARAVVKGGAETVLANPQRFLGVKEGEVPLVKRVGGAISELVIGEDKLTFRPLFSGQGLTKVTKALLESIAQNPELLRIGDDGIRKILAAVAKDVAKLKEPWSKDIFPEVMRLILEKSAQNMDLLWGREFKRPERHLLVTATRTFLAEISRKPPAGSGWRMQLSKSQVVGSLEAVLTEVADNPEWLAKRAGKSEPVLAEAVKAMAAALRRVDGKKLSADAGVAVLRAGIGAVATRISFLDEAGPAGAAAATTAIEAVLDGVFATIFAQGEGAEVHWKLAKNSAIVALVEATLTEVAEHETIDAALVEKVRASVGEELADPRPFDAERFAKKLRPAA